MRLDDHAYRSVHRLHTPSRKVQPDPALPATAQPASNHAIRVLARMDMLRWISPKHPKEAG
jgi:hypothetical protein